MKTLAITIVFICSWLYVYSQVMNGQVDNKKVLKFNENYFTFSKTFSVVIAGKKRQFNPAPITINSRNIYTSFDTPTLKEPKFKGDLSKYIFDGIKKELELLPDGKYTLNKMFLVVDKNGKLAYFDFDTLKAASGDIKTFSGKGKTGSVNLTGSVQDVIDQLGLRDAPDNSSAFIEPVIAKDIKLKIYFALYNVLKNCPKFKPAMRKGQPVDFILKDVLEVYEIKKHKAVLYKL